MFKILKDNKVIATVEKVVYSKRHPDIDTFIPADQYDAEIINVASLSQQFSVNGIIIDGLEQVVVVDTDGGEIIDNVNANVDYLADSLDINFVGEMSEKEQAVVKTHLWLRKELKKPFEWIDGNFYTVTEKKQSYLQSQLLIGSMKEKQGIAPEDIKLSWNESGKSKTPWDFLKLCKLSEDIHNYVEPLVIKQQNAEEKINESETSEEIAEILNEFAIQINS